MEYYEDEDDCITNFKTKFLAIVLDNTLTSDVAISCGPTVSPLNDNEIDIRISFDESDDEDYKIITEPTISPRHIDEFDLKDEMPLFECDEEEQNVLYFNDIFPFNVIYPDDLKSDTSNDNDKIDIEQPLGDMFVIPLPNVINVDTQSTVYTTYSLNEYSVYMYQYGVSWGMDTAYRLPI
ncbi:hypothetical protein Tco_0029964 [Tanacetum coccineum]